MSVSRGWAAPAPYAPLPIRAMSGYPCGEFFRKIAKVDRRLRIISVTTRSHSKRRNKTRAPSPPVLDRDEWFFRDVPENEIVTCFYYEYARSRDDVCRLVRSWRVKLADLRKAGDDSNTLEARERKFWSELAQLTDWTCAQLLVNLTQFPDVPWQRLSPSLIDERKTFLKFYAHLDDIRGGLRRESWNNVLNAMRSGDFATQGGELVPFLIDWQGGCEKVIDDFEAWARRRWREQKRKKKPRDTYSEWLKQLGVMRLKDKLMSWDRIQDYTYKETGVRLYADDLALWRKARLAAIKRMKGMFPITRTHSKNVT